MTNEGGKRTVEEEFVESWDGMEEFYRWKISRGNGDRDYLNPILEIMTQLRERGYDRTFRAGQSLHALVLSRSLKHGLRDDQPWLSIELYQDGSVHLWYREKPDVDIQLQVEKAEFNPQLEELCNRLLEHPLG